MSETVKLSEMSSEWEAQLQETIEYVELFFDIEDVDLLDVLIFINHDGRRLEQLLEQQEARSEDTSWILTIEETATVMWLLKSDLRPIEDVLSEFKFSRNRSFVICYSLALLLEDQVVLRGTGRLMAFAIIHKCYPRPSANLFVSQMINAASNESLEKYERAFVLHLLQWNSYNNANEILKQSAVDYTNSFDRSTHDFPELGELQREYGVKADLYVPRGCDPNSSEFDLQPGGNIKPGSYSRDEALTIMRFLTMGLQETFAPRDQQFITMVLANDPELAYQCGMTPQKLPELVEHNLEIAVVIFTKWINSPLIDDYFTALAKMPVSLQSMEVVKRLQTAVELPKDFVRMYITNCIRSCENAKFITTELAKDPDLVYNCGITPQTLLQLGKQNPELAVEILIKLINSPKDYITALASMEMSPEVVNRLKTAVEHPKEFISMYINCMPSCEKARFITMEFTNDPDLVCHCRITPQMLMELVEHNPKIAVEIVTKLINSPLIADLFTALANMKMSLHSMDVVNGLDAVAALSKDFIRKYITKCVSFAENPKSIPTELANHQDRVNTFLRQFITTKLANDPDLVNYCGITPQKLRQIVEHDPKIAYEIVTKLINSPDIAADDYFTALATMKMSLNSMEVVNMLNAVDALSKDFIRKYITKCVSFAENPKSIPTELANHQDRVNTFLRQFITTKLANDPDLVNHCGITTQKLRKIVEHDPKIAFEIVTKLINSSDITAADDYFTALVKMKISLNSMEVVNMLNAVDALTKDFKRKYMTKCISSCKNRKFITTELAKDPELIRSCRINPQKLREIVEWYPEIAVEIVTKLINSPDIAADDYFTALADMKISLESIEVVNKLKTKGVLTTDFIRKYITNCISFCENGKISELTQFITTELANDPDLIRYCGITPPKLLKIVEHNPEIAVEIVTKLINSPDIAADDYFTALVSTEISLHSMEVVNRLTTTLEVPKQFILMYITICISSCKQAEQQQDEDTQKRFVQLVCGFLHSLVRHNIIKVTDLSMEEVQALCLRYSKIREAADLYRLLKILE